MLAEQLIVEIEFWREMIDTQPVTFPPESIERMQQALALAEHKLALLQEKAQDAQQQHKQALVPGSQLEH